jgi:hypothetical protein
MFKLYKLKVNLDLFNICLRKFRCNHGFIAIPCPQVPFEAKVESSQFLAGLLL